MVRENSLEALFPELAAEWHPTKNGDLLPKQVTYGSRKKVWWLGLCGHEWEASVLNRRWGNGCPICARQITRPGVNDLATNNPELVAEWHPTKNGSLTPDQVMPGTHKKVWWLGSCGHEWEASIAHRSNKRGCPVCSGQTILPGFNDLATLNPDLAAEWHPTKNGDLLPSLVGIGSDRKVWWLGLCGHEWQDSISHRHHGRRCAVCAQEQKTSFPEQAIFFYLSKVAIAENRYMLSNKVEVDVYLPEYKIGIEYDGRWHTNAKKDLKKNRFCEKAGVRLIRIREPGLPPLPVECFVLDSTKECYLEQAIGHLCALVGIPTDIDINKDRSEIYARYIETTKQRSLAVIYPELAMEWHPTKNGKLTPSQVSAQSNKSVWWKCAEGHEWQAMVNSRPQNGCPYCSGHRVWQGYNDLVTTNPELAAQWHPTKNGNTKPSEVSKGSDKKVWWLGPCGHEWQASISNREKGRRCPICSNKQVLPGYNDLATVNPELAAEWHPTKNGDLLPKQVTYGSRKKVWWLGPCGHEWQAVITNRTTLHRGCPYCAGNKILPGFNDLASQNPNLAAQWHPIKNGTLTPNMVTRRSGKRAWWLGPCGHEWPACIAHRSNGSGCPICAGKPPRKG